MRYGWKRTLSGVALMAVLALPASAQDVTVTVNNRVVDFPDQQPVQRAGRVYIPLRGVLDRIGADTIQWRPARQEVFVASGPREIRLRIGEEVALVDGRTVRLDAPPILAGGRTMVPLRFVGENLGATVRWEGYTRTVHISVPQDQVAGQRETYPPDRVDDRNDRPRRDDRPRRNRDTAPLIQPMRPVPGETVASRRPEITAVIRSRGTTAIDYDAIRMTVNGQDVTRELELGVNSVTFRPSFDLERGLNRVVLTMRDRDGDLTTRDWSFQVR